SSLDHCENPRSIRRSTSKSQVSLTDDTLVVYPGDKDTTAGGADDVHGNEDAKETLPPKNLTLAKGKRRAQVTNTANHAMRPDLDEAYDKESLEVASNPDEQQEEYFLLNWLDSQSIVSYSRTHTERWVITHTPGYSPYEGHGSLLFL
ncbi:Sucrase-isomaltase, intestinal, partial [Phytophthora palmivora]